MASSTSTSGNDFPVSPVPSFGAEFTKTAACLIIGDEVLNGKTKDSNSHFMAKTLFDVAIELKRVEIIADDKEEIVEATRRLSERYDLVVTSGGLGPTLDDLTYPALAKAFHNEELEYHDETIRRMGALSKRKVDPAEQTEAQRKARNRMALFPVGAEVLFVQEDLWVPVVRCGPRKNVCLLPGVPSLFERLLTSFVNSYIPLPPAAEKPIRVLIHTEMPESSIAPYFEELTNRVKKEGIRVGSYPKLFAGVDVSLIGKDAARLDELAQEVVKELKGEVVSQGKIGEEVSTKL